MAIDTATGKEAPAEISSERVKDIFSTIAKKYERFNAVSSFGAYKTWLTGMMKQAPISANDDVLDIAGGTGDVSFTVARAKHPRHIQCTDLVNEMLDVARAHYADGAADGAGRGAEAAGEFGVGRELAAGYLQQQPPDSLAEIAAARGEGQLARLGALTGKIALQPGRCGPKNGQICLYRLRAEAGGVVFLPGYPEPSQHLPVRGQCELPHRRSQPCDVVHVSPPSSSL